MEEYLKLDAHAIRSSLEKSSRVTMQVISLAVPAGVLMFFACIMYLQSTRNMDAGQAVNPESETVRFLLLGLLVLSILAYVALLMADQLYYRSEKLERSLSSDLVLKDGTVLTDPVAKMCAIVQTLRIVKLAMLEAPALFGLVILLLSTLEGGGMSGSMVACLLPLLVMLVYTLFTFPTADRLADEMESRIVQNLRR